MSKFYSILVHTKIATEKKKFIKYFVNCHCFHYILFIIPIGTPILYVDIVLYTIIHPYQGLYNIRNGAIAQKNMRLICKSD